MFSKGPGARIIMIVHLSTIGFFIQACYSTPAKDGFTRESKIGQSQESRFVTSDEESGILLPADDKYNFVDDHDTTVSNWRTGRTSSHPPTTTIVSTNSYSIRPSSDTSDSSFVINARPVSMVTTGSSYTVKTNGDKYHHYAPKNSNKSTVFVKNNCFGHRCPENRRPDIGGDEWKSYHYIMNQGIKNNKHQRKLYNSNRPSRRNNDVDSSRVTHEMSLSVPFRVDPTISKYDTSYPSKFNRRVLPNSTPSSSSTTTPGWVKLQPILSDQYDPFTLKSNKSHNKLRNKPHESTKVHQNPNSQFADRLGIELDPNSFAERWGWGERHSDKGGGGSRYPAWLQGVENVKGGSDRDTENRNWVKLEPIPVAAVTISKWAPKGTPNSELPSTNWPSRDPVHSSNGLGHSNPSTPTNTKWWDIIDNINRLNQNRPQYGPPAYDVPPHGWSSNKGPTPSSWDRDRTPQNPWGDIIYPNGPASATASWQQDKDMSKYPSSFPSPNSSPWQSDIRRPTGSWSADREGGGNRRQGSGTYPDRHTSEDDPRWVLVSNSKKVTLSSTDRHHPSYPPIQDVKYRPDFDKFSDFPYYERPPNKNRRGKEYNKDLVKITNITVTKAGSYVDQDAAFKKINATLASLTPVLTNRKRGQREASSDTTSTSSKKPGFLQPYFGDGRGMANTEATTLVLPTRNQVRQGISINPVYAAVGAGLVPASMAAVLPMILGRRRRDVRFVIEAPVRNGVDEQQSEGNHFPQDQIFRTIAQPRRKGDFQPLLSYPQLSFPSINTPNSRYLRLRML